MKNKVIIISVFVLIVIAMLGVWFYAYRPTFSTSTFSSSNSDWGGFGDFFWGLGTMLLTALNIYIFYKVNAIIEKNKLAKDKLEMENDRINEYKSLRDECLKRISADVFVVDTNYIAQLDSYIRELRRFENIFPFLRDERKRDALNTLQKNLRLLHDPKSLNEWSKTHSKDELDSLNCVTYSFSEWILQYMMADRNDTINEYFKTRI